jgi:beta-glucanase (GH16 family)
MAACAERSTSWNKVAIRNRHLWYHALSYGNGSVWRWLTTTIAGASTAFTLTALWTPTYIRLSVDGTDYYTLANYTGLPFNQPFFIILNVAMGGNFGGTVDPAFTTDSMEVDYVRVYK